MSSTDRLYKYLSQVSSKDDCRRIDSSAIESELGAMMKLPDTVCYINSYTNGEILFHSGFETVLGYPKTVHIDQQFILDTIHPDDQPIAHYLIHMASVLHMEYRTDLLPFTTAFEINYRVRKYNGNYIMMLKRSTGFMNDQISSGANLSVLQDISYLNLPTHVRSRVKASEEAEKRYNQCLHEIQSKHVSSGPFSNRQMDVLLYLARGFQSSEIAEKLFISKHTVDNHRKNMLRKTGLKNTAELVRYGLENRLL